LTPKEIIPTQEKYNSQVQNKSPFFLTSRISLLCSFFVSIQLTELRKEWAADYKSEQQRISEEKASEFISRHSFGN
jgi:hypothetical protein